MIKQEADDDQEVDLTLTVNINKIVHLHSLLDKYKRKTKKN